jgi:hypothetical protein
MKSGRSILEQNKLEASFQPSHNNSMKNKEQQENYLKNGHLINKKIQCNKCEAEVTMFGSNLENRIKKFGTLWSLLDEFKCRKCTSASKPAKPIKEKKARKVKLHKKINEEGEVVYDIPKMKFTVPRNVFLKDAPDLITSMTQSTCVNPTLYLDNARNCNGCAFWTHCQCKLRTENEFACAS